MSETWKRVSLFVGGALLFVAGYAGGRLGGHATGAGDPAGEIVAALRDARHQCAGSATASCYAELGGDKDKLVACLADRVGSCEERFVTARARAIAGAPVGTDTAKR